MTAPSLIVPRFEIELTDKSGHISREWYKFFALLAKSNGTSLTSSDDGQVAQFDEDELFALSPLMIAPYLNLQQTAAEAAANVTPVNFGYPVGDVRRYGAVGDGVTADDVAIQTAITVAQQGNTAVYLIPGAQHYLASGISFKQGKASGDPKSYFVYLEGRFATLRPGPGVTAISIVPRCLLADVGTGRAIAPIYLLDVTIDGGSAGVTGANALLIGAAGLRWDSFSWSVVRNFNVQNLTQTAGGQAVMLIEGRHCTFQQFNLRAGASLFIQAVTANSFIGDFVFSSCEMNGSAAQPPLTITAGGGGTNSQARGIKFVACDIYGGGTFIHATGNGQVGDIWFASGCQFDSASGTDVFVTLFNDSAIAQMFDIHFVDGYFNGGTQALYVHMVASATMKQIEIGSNVINGMNIATAAVGGAALYGLNCNGLSIHDNVFDQCTGNGSGSSYINLDGVTNFMVNNNQATNATTMTYGVSYGDAITKYSIIGNLLNCTTVTNDYHTGSPVGQVANNLAV